MLYDDYVSRINNYIHYIRISLHVCTGVTFNIDVCGLYSLLKCPRLPSVIGHQCENAANVSLMFDYAYQSFLEINLWIGKTWNYSSIKLNKIIKFKQSIFEMFSNTKRRAWAEVPFYITHTIIVIFLLSHFSKHREKTARYASDYARLCAFLIT